MSKMQQPGAGVVTAATAWGSPGFEIPTYTVTDAARVVLEQIADALGDVFDRSEPATQLTIARFAALHINIASPELAAAIYKAMREVPIQRVRGVPVTGGAALIATTLSLLRGGEVFQYHEQLGGVLTAPIEPKVGSAANSNSSPDPFGIHTDDAVMPAPFRVEEIALLGVHNPPGTLTGFALLDAVLDRGELTLASREHLMDPRYGIKSPNAFSLADDHWLDCVAILSHDGQGRMEIAFPSYNTRPTWSNDHEAERALANLTAALEAAMIDIYIEPGDWLVWNNSLLAHRRGAIGEGRRLLWRNYLRRDCDAMREATGTPGPIFSANALLNSGTAVAEETRYAG